MPLVCWTTQTGARVVNTDMEFAVIIAGTRTFGDYELLCQKCDVFFSAKKPTHIICGEARGADTLGRRYAEEHNIPVLSFPADWKTYGKSAGYRRNKQMAEAADALVAFWDGKSRGTKNMIDLAHEAKIPVRVVRYE